MNKLFPFVSVLFSCSMFEYNPNDFELDEHEKNLTAKNLARIEGQPAGDSVLMIFAGDTQRYYEDTRDFVNAVNKSRHADFVMISGDISDFGLPIEFKWMNEIYSSLRFPYLTAIGNHDLLANGRYVYDEMFGETDYSFIYGRYKFVVCNTNGREYGFNGSVPDLVFLENEFLQSDSDKYKVLICHVAPGNIDFEPALNEDVGQIINQTDNFLGGFHGHNHGFHVRYPFGEDMPFISSSSTSQRNFLEVLFYHSDGRDTFNVRQIYY